MKKLLFLLLCTFLIIQFSNSFAEEKTYKDVPTTHWAYEAIQYFDRYNIIEGYDDGTFKPDNVITRAEFAKILSKLETDKEIDVSEIEFLDVSKFHWAYDEIKIGSVYMKDNLKNRFRPDAYLTRKEAAITMANMLADKDTKYDVNVLRKFSDFNLIISGDAENDIAFVVEKGVMNGYPDNTFRPNGNVTRAQVLEIFYNIFVNIPQKQFENTYSGENELTFGNFVKKMESAKIEDYFSPFIPAEGVEVTSPSPSMMSESWISDDGWVYYYSVVTVASQKGQLGDYEWYTYFYSGDERWERLNYNGKVTKNIITEKDFDYEKRHEQISILKTKKGFEDLFLDKFSSEREINNSGSLKKDIGISIEVSIGDNILQDGGTYSINNEQSINAKINNATTEKSFIYYMFAYGNYYQNMITKKVESNQVEITIPDEITGNRFKLSIWGTNLNNGKNNVTETSIITFNYTDKKYVPSTCEINVRHNGILISSSEVNDAGRGEQIKITGTIPEEVNLIKYMWDTDSQMTEVQNSSAIIEIPSKFVIGSKHILTVELYNKYGNLSERKDYTFNIDAKTIRASLDFMITYGGRVYTEDAVFENANTNQSIIVRGKPVNNVQYIQYKWDIEKEPTILFGATGTIDIPKTFNNGETHVLKIVVVDKAGNVSEQRNYTFVIKER